MGPAELLLALLEHDRPDRERLVAQADPDALTDPNIIGYLASRPALVTAWLGAGRVLPNPLRTAVLERITSDVVVQGLEDRLDETLPLMCRLAADGLGVAIREEIFGAVAAYIGHVAAPEGRPLPSLDRAQWALSVLAHDPQGFTDLPQEVALREVGVRDAYAGAVLRHPQLSVDAWLEIENELDIGTHAAWRNQVHSLLSEPPANLASFDPQDIVMVLDRALDLDETLAARMYRKAADRLVACDDPTVRLELLDFPVGEVRLHAIAHLRPDGGEREQESGRTR